MTNKSIPSMLSLIMAVVAVALMGLSPARQAWLINAWSLQYAHRAFSPAAKQSVLAEPPAGHARASFWLAKDALEDGDFSLAHDILDSRLSGGDRLVLSLYGELLDTQGDQTGAINYWLKAQNISKILEAAEHAVDDGNLDVAFNAYQAFYDLDSKKGVEPLADFFFFQLKDYNGAVAILRHALSKDDSSRKYQFLWLRRLGDYARFEKNWFESIMIYKQLLEINPNSWSDWFRLGQAYEGIDNLGLAQNAYENAISIEPNSGIAYFSMGEMMARAGRYDEADSWFHQAIERDSSKETWYITRANYLLYSGHIQLAIELYEQTIALFPNSAAGYYELSWGYYLNKQQKDAINAIHNAITLMEKPNDLYYARAGTLYENTDYPDLAIYYYRLSIEQNPNNQTAINGLLRLEKDH